MARSISENNLATSAPVADDDVDASRQRGRFRIANIGLWLLILSVAALIAGGLAIGWPYSRERQIVAMVDAMGGGEITLVWIGPNGLQSWLPAPLAEPFYRIHGVRVHGPQYRDEHLSLFARARRLKTLSIQHTSITDAGLARLVHCSLVEDLSLASNSLTGEGLSYLAKLPNLRVLRLDNVELGDNELVHLAEMPKLSWVSLEYAGVGDEALPHLGKVQGLRELHLGATRVTDAGLESLASLPVLRKLNLRYTPITNSALEPLSRIPHLDTLNLEGTMIRNERLEPLTRFAALRDLDLRGTIIGDEGLITLGQVGALTHLKIGRPWRTALDRPRITDAGATHLRSLTNLQQLVLEATRVTERMVDDLRTNALPGCEIIAEPSFAGFPNVLVPIRPRRIWNYWAP